MGRTLCTLETNVSIIPSETFRTRVQWEELDCFPLDWEEASISSTLYEFDINNSAWTEAARGSGHDWNRGTLTCMGDWKAVGRLEVVDIVVEVERLFSGVLVGVVELDSEPERAVLLHRGTHEQSPFKEMKTKIRQRFHSRICAF